MPLLPKPPDHAPPRLASDPLYPTIFHEGWWLDAAAPQGWAEVTVTAGDRVIGRLPYVMKRGRIAGATCTMPDLCHFLGPAVDAGKGAACNRALRRHQITRELIDSLPPHGRFDQRMHRDVPDVLVFAEAGFHTPVQFTFEVAPERTDRLWADMRDKTRNIIRRAEERHSVSDDLTPAAFAQFYVTNARATGAPSYYAAEALDRITTAALARDRGRLLAARTAEGAIAAAVFCVWDGTCCYYLLSMRDKGAENGATSLLVWTAMQHAAARGLIFDFDGLRTRGNRVFFTGFGGVLHPRYLAQRQTMAHRIWRHAGAIPGRLAQGVSRQR